MIETFGGAAAIAAGLSLFFFWSIRRAVHVFETARNGRLMDSSAGLGQQFQAAMSGDNRAWVINALACVVGGLVGLSFGPVAAVAGAGAGFAIPWLVTRLQTAKRNKLMMAQLIVTLETLTSAMRAGLSITQAIEATQRALERPMLDEFSIMVRQLKVGMQLEEVLQQFAERNPATDVKLTVTTILISTRTGADLVTAMDRLTSTIKRRGIVEAKIHTLTLSGKMQAIVASVFPFLLLGMMLIFDYEYASILFTSLLGNLVLLGVGIMQVIAFFVIMQVTAIDV